MIPDRRRRTKDPHASAAWGCLWLAIIVFVVLFGGAIGIVAMVLR